MRSEKIRCRKLWEIITDDGSQSKTERERDRGGGGGGGGVVFFFLSFGGGFFY
jgi:hypothetical protein